MQIVPVMTLFLIFRIGYGCSVLAVPYAIPACHLSATLGARGRKRPKCPRRNYQTHAHMYVVILYMYLYACMRTQITHTCLPVPQIVGGDCPGARDQAARLGEIRAVYLCGCDTGVRESGHAPMRDAGPAPTCKAAH